jgi:gliding motility-associated-like protein
MRRLFTATVFILSVATEGLFAQCTGAQSFTITPNPGGTCTPGEVYTICYTMNGYNQLGANWVDGFEVNLSGPWQGNPVPVSPPANCNGGAGSWIWSNNVTGSFSGQSHGPGYFFDLNPDGNPGNDYGDNGPDCTWTFCFDVTVGNTPGANISVGVTALSDGEVGSWGSTACNGSNFPILSCIIDLPCGTLTAAVNQNETCPGDADGQATANFVGGVPPINYSWNTVPAQNTATATGLSAGNYTVTITDGNGCSLQENVTITNGSSSDATMNNVNATNELCSDDAAVQITSVEAGGTFSGTGVNSTGLFNPATANIGINTITYTVGNTCPDIQTMDITVYQTADATIDPVNPTNQLCTGNPPVQLTAATAGGTWSGNGVSAAGLFDPMAAGPGVHTITYAIVNPCGDTQTMDITVGDLTFTPSSTASICTADNGTATVTPITGTAPFTYTWATTPVQTTATATDLASGDYDVTIEDNNGCSITTTITVPFDAGNLAVNGFSTASICTADNGTATANAANGTMPYTYQWTTSPVQTTQTATDLAAGSYDVTIEDTNGCTATTTVNVNFDAGNLAVNINASTDVSCNGLCDGDATSTISGGTVPILYGWDDPDNQTTQVATGLCAGTYNVGVMDANGCLATDQIVITEPTAISATAVMDQESNCGQPDGEATATGSGGSVAGTYQYSWDSNPVQNTATATGLSPATYNVTVTDDNGCEATAILDITTTQAIGVSINASTDATCFQFCDGEATATPSANAVAPVTYSWNSSPAQNAATAVGLCAGNYTVTATDNVGCIATASVTVSEPDELVAQVNSSVSQICIGQSTDLTSSASGGTPPVNTYSWTATPADPSLVANSQNPTVSPLVTTTYELIAMDASGCASSAETITINVSPPLSLSVVRPAYSPDTAICRFDMATLDLNATGGDGNYSYYLLPDMVNPIQFPIQVQPNTTTTYDFMVEDGCGTPQALAASTITVNQLPTANFSANVVSGCQPLTAQFTDLSSPTPTVWNWNFGDSNSSANSSTTQNPTHSFQDAGLYSVSLSITSAVGCTSDTSFADLIEVFPLPNTNFSADPARTTLLEGTVQFTDLTIGDVAEWSWQFGDGETSDIQHPENMYLDTGVYTVVLDVITTDGCVGSDRQFVIIEPDFMFYVPNAFSPNFDGKNDFFRGYGSGVQWDTYEMFIYNRWGEEIYFTNNVDQPWDGTFKGAQAPEELYVWMIRVYDEKGEQHTFRGRATLFR